MIYYVALFWLALPCLGLAAWLWGGPPERWVASLYAGAALLSRLHRMIVGPGWTAMEAWLLGIDLLLLAFLIAIELRWHRPWLIAAVAFQGLTSMSHLARVLDPTFSGLAYALMEGASSYPALVVLTVGIWQHRQATKRPAPRTSAGYSATPPRRQT